MWTKLICVITNKKRLIISILHILIWTESQKSLSVNLKVNRHKEHMDARVGKLILAIPPYSHMLSKNMKEKY